MLVKDPCKRSFKRSFNVGMWVKDPLMLALLSLDIPQIEEPPTGLVAELKVRVGNSIWECFRNMSATGTAIVMELLTLGTGNIGKQGKGSWFNGQHKTYQIDFEAG